TRRKEFVDTEYTRIGAVTKKLWSKNREGKIVIWSKSQIFIALSLLSPVSLSLSSRFGWAATSRPSNRSPGHHTWGQSPGPSQMNHDTTANNPRPSAAAAVAGVGRNSHGSRWFVRMQLELPVQISPPFLHQIDRVRHQEPDRILKETSEGSK
ncbi:hypothetical protein Prudu_021800, partial [Prunus dulcis]